MNTPRIELGDRARHVITGFEGIVTAKCLYLEGCERICLTPETCKDDGSLKEGVYFDAPYVDVVDKAAVKPRGLDGEPLQPEGESEIVPLRVAGPSATPGRSSTIDPPTR